MKHVLLLVVIAGCADAEGLGLGSIDRAAQSIYYGTRTPQNVSLTDGEILAVGYLADEDGDEFCTGTLTTQRLVITAEHCIDDEQMEDIRFGVGTRPTSPTALFSLSALFAHPDTDFAVLVLDRDASDEVPEIEPIAFNREALDAAWDERWVDAAGYGDTHDDSTGRFFASVQIVGWDDEIVHVDGHGEQGICYGDSGGPILWQDDPEAAPVVVGTEQWGDSSCVDNDYLTRVDLVAAFIDEIIENGAPAGFVPCGDVTYDGECEDNTLRWCDNGRLATNDCGQSGRTCGFQSPTRGYNCLSAACQGIDYRGVCEGDSVKWCERGELETLNCASEGASCAWQGEDVGYYCTEDEPSDGGDGDVIGGDDDEAPLASPTPKRRKKDEGCASASPGLAWVLAVAMLVRRRGRL